MHVFSNANKYFLFLFFSSTSLFAEDSQTTTVRILFRPSIMAAADLFFGGIASTDMMPSQVSAYLLSRVKTASGPGHVAIELPPKTLPGGDIFGWRPAPAELAPSNWNAFSPAQQTAFLLGRSPSNRVNTLRGFFWNDAQWATEGRFDPISPTMTISVPITYEQLITIKENILKITFDPKYKYQMIPDYSDLPSLGAHLLGFQPNSFNCVTIMTAVFRGTGINLDFIPRDGSVQKFVSSVRNRATLWNPPRPSNQNNRACVWLNNL